MLNNASHSRLTRQYHPQMKTSWHCVILTLLYLAHFRPDLIIVGTALLMSSLCLCYSLVSLTLASADHMPIYGPLWLPGCVYNGRCGRDQWWWPLRGNFTITCHGTWLLARTTANWADKTLAIAQSWPTPRPPIMLDTDHEAVLVTRPSWHNKQVSQVSLWSAVLDCQDVIVSYCLWALLC